MLRRACRCAGRSRRRRPRSPERGSLIANQVPAGISAGKGTVQSWDLRALDLKPRLPEILSTNDAARAIALDLAAGESLSDHEVHERAWLVVLDGKVDVSSASGGWASGGAGLLVELAPGERHEVTAAEQSRLLLLLTPWPGDGHPGAMTIREKLYARRHAAKRAAGS
jgi:quercetin dioxygenase-like cupin family protein